MPSATARMDKVVSVNIVVHCGKALIVVEKLELIDILRHTGRRDSQIARSRNLRTEKSRNHQHHLQNQHASGEGVGLKRFEDEADNIRLNRKQYNDRRQTWKSDTTEVVTKIIHKS